MAVLTGGVTTPQGASRLSTPSFEKRGGGGGNKGPLGVIVGHDSI